MNGYSDFFRGKKITVLGLGLLGRGVGDVEFLAHCGAEVLVTDRKSEPELTSSIEKLKHLANVSFRLGGHDEKDFTSCDLVIKAAGVPLNSPFIAAARGANVDVAMSTALFAKFAMEAGATIVGVTGTRGKSTVSHMIYHALKKAGKPVYLGGNVRGVSTLAMLPQVRKGDMYVLELDSWQLQGFGDLKISPHVAVFTNLMPDHQNYYANMDEYFTDKAFIFKYQKEDDALFIGQGIEERVRASHPSVEPAVIGNLPDGWELKVPGAHNRSNAAFASAALLRLGLTIDKIKDGLESFEGVEGRLQLLSEVRGVKIYNDNNATTPEATIAALRALGEHITLIVGGSEKGLDLTELVSEMQRRVSHIILLTHENYKGSVRLAAALKEKNIPYEEASSLRQAYEQSLRLVERGTILFSPAFASFGMFQNEYERNDQFIALVKEAGAK